MIRLATDDGVIRLDTSAAADRDVSLAGDKVLALAGEWAVLDDGSVVTVDGGARVTSLDGLSPWCVASAAASSAGTSAGTALVGTSKARLFRVQADGAAEPVESFDRIPTRDEWYTPWGGPPDTRSLAVTSDGSIMVNVHVGGIWAGGADGSAGSGGSAVWEPVVEVDADVHQVAALPDRPVVAAAAAIGCGVSVDGGRSWKWSDDGLHASYSRAVAITGDVVLVTASTGPSSRSGALYRRGLTSDRPFERCDRGLPASFPFNLDTFTLAADDREAVLGTPEGHLYRSLDQGETWDFLADDLPAIHAVTID